MSHDEASRFYFSRLDNGWEVGRFGALDESHSVVHAITTRSGPDPALIGTEAEAAAHQIGDALALRDVAWCRQVHGADVLRVTAGGLGGDGDAMVTDVRSLGLMMACADCPVLLAVDSVAGAIGLAHASWRGTVRGIASNLIASLADCFGTRAEDVLVCIGPSAGPCCYEVGPDVRSEAIGRIGPQAEHFFINRDGKLYFDLWSANTDQLIGAGVKPANIHLSGKCTMCNNDRFPSYRIEGAKAGRFAVVLGFS